MFLYNINYDNKTNAIAGDNIVIPEGSGSKSQIALTADIDSKYSVYIEFSAPKGNVFRSEKMELTGGKYLLTVPGALAKHAGAVDVQLVFIGPDSVEKSLVNSGIISIAPSVNAAADAEETSKTVLDTIIIDNLRQDESLDAVDEALRQCEATAGADKFVAEIVYDMSSASPELNCGFPSGLYKGNRINNLNLSKYRYLIIDCQMDRNLTLFMDLTEKNKTNNLYINSVAGATEWQKTYALIAFEVIVNLQKTYLHLNNTVRSESYTVPSVLVVDKTAYISKVTGII